MRPPDSLALAIGGVLVSAVAASFWYVTRNRITPAEREKRRRALVHLRGRMNDAEVTDITEEAVYYSYSVHGVNYLASQEIAPIRHLLRDNLGSLVGPATVKFISKNPVNSIVVCEDWSGFLRGTKHSAIKGAQR